MTPISQFIKISPVQSSDVTDSGLLSASKFKPVAKGIVLEVSPDIKDSQLITGDQILYQAGRSKLFAGEYFLNIQFALAKIKKNER